MKLTTKKKIKRFAEFLIIKLLIQIVLFLPRKIALKFGKLLGTLFYCIDRKGRKVVKENLHKVYGENFPDISIEKLCYQNLGKNLVDPLRISLKKNSEHWKMITSINGLEILNAELEKGNGIICLSPHLGSWELLAVILCCLGFKVNAVTRKLYDNRIDEMVKNLRKSFGLIIHDRDIEMAKLIKVLQNREILGILMDQDTKVSGVFINFLGHEAHSPIGPAIIALKTNAPVIPISIILGKDNIHHITIEPPVNLIRTDNFKNDIITNTTLFNNILGKMILSCPEQWVWFHRRWKKRQDEKKNE